MIERINERKRAGEGGFTLIELLVVIIILGILAGVVVFAVGGINDKGQGAACKIDSRTLRTSLEAFAGSNAGNGFYTDDESVLVSTGFLSTTSTLHRILYKDPDGAGPFTLRQGFILIVEDAKCGTVNNVVGQTPSDL